MGGKIDLYFDCVSPYSFFALHHLLKNKEALDSHDVVLELHPIFQGGVMQKSGNKPPFSVPAKGAHGVFDRERAIKYFGLDITSPDFFPIMSLLPQRCLTSVKAKYPAKLQTAVLECYKMMWQEGLDISKSDIMLQSLERNFTQEEAADIIQASGSPEIKAKLMATTDEVLEYGAYGSPWFMVTSPQGVKEPFFGSDRFHYIWQHLELPWTDIQLQPKSKI